MGNVGGKIMIPIFHPLAAYLLSTLSPRGLTAANRMKAAAALGYPELIRVLTAGRQE
jgi:hypothetical protein